MDERVLSPSPRAIARAAEVVRRGGLVAFPTETVYGLGADARDPRAVARIFAVKGRPSDHPLIVHVGSADAMEEWALDVPVLAHTFAARFWPGPLTLVLRRAADVLDEVTGGQHTVGLRVPSHPVALALIRASGCALAAPSANRFGRVSPTTAAHVRDDLGDDVDLILDGGPCEVGVESTIVDLSGREPAILRPGGVPREALEAVAGTAIPVRTVIAGLGGRPILQESLARMIETVDDLDELSFLDLRTDLVEREIERTRSSRRSGPTAENLLRDVGAVGDPHGVRTPR